MLAIGGELAASFTMVAVPTETLSVVHCVNMLTLGNLALLPWRNLFRIIILLHGNLDCIGIVLELADLFFSAGLSSP